MGRTVVQRGVHRTDEDREGLVVEDNDDGSRRQVFRVGVVLPFTSPRALVGLNPVQRDRVADAGIEAEATMCVSPVRIAETAQRQRSGLDALRAVGQAAQEAVIMPRACPGEYIWCLRGPLGVAGAQPRELGVVLLGLLPSRELRGNPPCAATAPERWRTPRRWWHHQRLRGSAQRRLSSCGNGLWLPRLEVRLRLGSRAGAD
mmetsp:Transcript_29938/g.65290  ORF Transcript_29938/g.65290 Transcript_29938/m.65290 type:complete len:203 (+) Transcript_29938:1194-1802(+)